MKHHMTDSRMNNAIVHESELISDTLCNGCLCLEVRTKRKRRKFEDVFEEKYFCSKKRCYVIPKAIKDCKLRCMTVPHVDMPKFNRAGL